MLPDAIIVDLDGTLADVSAVRHLVKNSPRDFAGFHGYATTDAPVNQHVAWMTDHFYGDILLVTGRHEKWRKATHEWLREHGVSYDELYMRADGDYRKDYVVKREIYDECIAGKYDVVFAVDDNPNIIALWRSLNIPCFVVPGWDD